MRCKDCKWFKTYSGVTTCTVEFKHRPKYEQITICWHDKEEDVCEEFEPKKAEVIE